LRRCPEARGNIDFDLTLTRKSSRKTLGPRGATLADHVFAPSNGFRAAVYDSIGPLSTFMTVNSGTRWLPEPETFGSKSGRGVARGTNGWPSVVILQSASKWWQVPKKSRAIGRLKLLRTSTGCRGDGTCAHSLTAPSAIADTSPRIAHIARATAHRGLYVGR